MSTKELKSLVSTMFANIDQDLSEQSFFKTTQEKLGIKPSTICFAVVAIVSILAVLDIAADILTTLFGMAYPAFMSFKVVNPLPRQLRGRMKNKRMYGSRIG
jgi:hypothetical protein